MFDHVFFSIAILADWKGKGYEKSERLVITYHKALLALFEVCRSDNTTSDEEALKVMKVQHVCYFVNRKNARLIPYNQLLSNFI